MDRGTFGTGLRDYATGMWATLDQYRPVHRDGWMVSAQDTVFCQLNFESYLWHLVFFILKFSADNRVIRKVTLSLGLLSPPIPPLSVVSAK